MYIAIWRAGTMFSGHSCNMSILLHCRVPRLNVVVTSGWKPPGNISTLLTSKEIIMYSSHECQSHINGRPLIRAHIDFLRYKRDRCLCIEATFNQCSRQSYHTLPLVLVVLYILQQILQFISINRILHFSIADPWKIVSSVDRWCVTFNCLEMKLTHSYCKMRHGKRLWWLRDNRAFPTQIICDCFLS